MFTEEVVMVIQLTPEQLQALDTGERSPARVVDPRGNVSYVLVSESDYETVRDILEDEQRQRSIRAVGLRNAIGRMSEVP
jgi:PHD/YefM family antitoxin component YafN of YafNO toxin-antitoxin module